MVTPDEGALSVYGRRGESMTPLSVGPQLRQFRDLRTPSEPERRSACPIPIQRTMNPLSSSWEEASSFHLQTGQFG